MCCNWQCIASGLQLPVDRIFHSIVGGLQLPMDCKWVASRLQLQVDFNLVASANGLQLQVDCHPCRLQESRKEKYELSLLITNKFKHDGEDFIAVLRFIFD